MPLLNDRATLTGAKKTRAGFVAAQVRATRAGVFLYQGAELGDPSRGTVRVLRPESEVFDERAMRSLANVPLTWTHPSQPVTADTWKTSRVIGHTGSRVIRSGDFVVVEILAMDGDAVAAIEAGTNALSAGYRCDIAYTPGTLPDGTTYDAVQHGITYDHLSVVPAGRAGPEVVIPLGDAALTGDKTMADEQALAARRQMLADESREIADAARQALMADEAWRRDPATPYGAYVARLANAWKGDAAQGKGG